MNNELMLHQEELVENPSARLPVCLVLDTSASMSGQPINELQEGVSIFFSNVLEDEIAKYSAEVAIVTFGEKVEMPLDFAPISNQQIPKFSAKGLTPMGEAVEKAVKLLNLRKDEYRHAGVDSFKPWLVLMTDGAPTDDITEASKTVEIHTNENKLAVFAIGVGKNAAMDKLALLSGGRAPMKLKGLEFSKFFSWLSASITRISHSTPTDDVELDPVSSWATV